jgi:hypothetical protein
MLLKNMVCLLEGDDTDVFYGNCPVCEGGVVITGNDLRRGNIVCSRCDEPPKPTRELRVSSETYIGPAKFRSARDLRKPIFAAVAAARESRRRRRSGH